MLFLVVCYCVLRKHYFDFKYTISKYIYYIYYIYTHAYYTNTLFYTQKYRNGWISGYLCNLAFFP